MGCQNCANHVTEALEKVKGVESVTVSLANKSATIVENGAKDSALMDAVREAGYTPVSID